MASLIKLLLFFFALFILVISYGIYNIINLTNSEVPISSLKVDNDSCDILNMENGGAEDIEEFNKDYNYISRKYLS